MKLDKIYKAVISNLFSERHPFWYISVRDTETYITDTRVMFFIPDRYNIFCNLSDKVYAGHYVCDCREWLEKTDKYLNRNPLKNTGEVREVSGYRCYVLRDSAGDEFFVEKKYLDYFDKDCKLYNGSTTETFLLNKNTPVAVYEHGVRVGVIINRI